MRLALKLGHDELHLILLSHLQQTLSEGKCVITRVDDMTIVRRRGGQFEVDVQVTVFDDADPSTWATDVTNGESDE